MQSFRPVRSGERWPFLVAAGGLGLVLLVTVLVASPASPPAAPRHRTPPDPPARMAAGRPSVPASPVATLAQAPVGPPPSPPSPTPTAASHPSVPPAPAPAPAPVPVKGSAAAPAAGGKGAARSAGADLPGADRPRPEPNRSAPDPAVVAPAPGAVWTGDFPDPDVIRVGSVYYAYSTEVGPTYVPVISSVDLVHWQYVGDALPALPTWSDGREVWAPDVVASATGYVLFYASRDAQTGQQCIGRAISALPEGPFIDTSLTPFLCQEDQGGDIDPDAFEDANGDRWLLWKSQGTLSGQPARIWSQPVVGDWSGLSGSASILLQPTQAWEDSVVEAPYLFRQGPTYYLLYSGNDWDSAGYGIGYAVCATAAGPCSKPRDGPVLASHGGEAGPGSPAVFTDPLGRLRVAFHAWTEPDVGYPAGVRSLHLGTIVVAGDDLSIQG